MEIKKEDFVRFRIVDQFFYALPVSFFKDKTTIAEVIKEEVKEVIEEVKPTKKELAAIAKADKIAKLKEELAAMVEIVEEE